ncbi:MAG: S-methyl-5-thioribose-1-phosphate isomerase [Deltaproteobacteria bacterium]|nr:S-methyl-5-thioribose-1-phosphate isomerase [Deltaproteobacteria bacterium]
MIRTIYWDNNAVVMIDQKALPLQETYLTCKHYEEVIKAINDLTVRGAPAIGVAAALGIALGALCIESGDPEGFRTDFYRICERFAATRPTARNLFWAVEKMKKRFAESASLSPARRKEALVAEAIRICEEDSAANRAMGRHGRSLIKNGDTILTHCNAGALATAGYGTALGVIRAAREEGKELHVFVDETRPVLQGARLTAWELTKENIPATLITDSMAGSLMQQGRINLIIVGADRIALNGDTANKIGTYTLAVLAKEHGIPFYIAAPLSTIDLSVQEGRAIPIEEREGEEVSCYHGVRTAPAGIKVYNPAFDVTPHRYITAIITEKGIATAPYGESLQRLVAAQAFG